jgi:peptidoglycan/xylan/chitin deacetylase (PgdA/CDA1 family)
VGKVYGSSVGRVIVVHRTEQPQFVRRVHGMQRRFDLISIDAAVERLEGRSGAAARHRFAALTFDDGYRDFLGVMDVLGELQVPACLYIARCCLDQPGFLRTSEVRAISETFDIGSHTLSHRRLLDLDVLELTHELEDSRHYLEDLIGKPVVHFAAPFGNSSSFDRSAVRIAARAGYATFRTTFRGWNAPRSTDEPGIRLLRADVIEDWYPGWRVRATLAGALDVKAALRLSAAMRS